MSATATANDSAEELLAEKLKLLNEMGKGTLFTSQVVACVALVTFWNSTDQFLLMIWYGLLSTVNAARFIGILLYERTFEVGEHRRWLRYYQTGAFLSGCLWAVLSLFLDLNWPIIDQLTLFLIFTGLTAGAIPANAVYYPVYFSFIAPPLMLLAVHLVNQGTPGSWGVAGLVLIYWALMFFTSRKYSASVTRSMELRQENLALMEKISSANLELTYQASHDPLTGLLNRREFEEQLGHALKTSRIMGRTHVCCYLDLDQFKVVNDTCGHVAGDTLLRQLSYVLVQILRGSDIFARIGGDEFGLLLDGCPLSKGVEIAENLLEEIRNFRFVWEGKTFEVGASIGVVEVNENSQSAADILSLADMACYAAKDSGRNRVHVSEENDQELSRRRGEMQWVNRLREALHDDRLELFGQKIIPIGFPEAKEKLEILLRMRDEDGNLINPGSFLQAAERFNLMPTIDRWVVDKSFAWCAKAGNESATLNINLSGVTLNDPEFLDYVRDRLRHWQVKPQLICFEITETAAVANLYQAANFMQELKRLGCEFALDDFGTGLSSFGYLKNLPVNYIKIDGSFIRDIAKDDVDRALVQAIVTLAKAMRIRTVAEWVEDERILHFVEGLGVDYAQGYGVGKPYSLAQPKDKVVMPLLSVTSNADVQPVEL